MNKGSLLVEETLPIPLMISLPDVSDKRTNDTLIGDVDIAPTMLNLYDLPALTRTSVLR